MADTKFDVPIWHKTNLTVEEAAAYSGIGSQKLREMSDSLNTVRLFFGMEQND